MCVLFCRIPINYPFLEFKKIKLNFIHKFATLILQNFSLFSICEIFNIIDHTRILNFIICKCIRDVHGSETYRTVRCPVRNTSIRTCSNLFELFEQVVYVCFDRSTTALNGLPVIRGSYMFGPISLTRVSHDILSEGINFQF